MINGVFFDLYGTLLIYRDLASAWRDWQAEFYVCLVAHGLSWSSDELAARCEAFFTAPAPAMIGDGLTVYERKIRQLGHSAGLQLDRDALQAVAARTIEVWQRHIPVDPDAVPILKDLKARGKYLALITNYDHPPHVHSLLANLGLADLFKTVVISGAVGIKKPDPRIFGYALSPSGLKPDEVLHVGDSEEDIAGARAAGIHPVLLQRSESAAVPAASPSTDVTVIRRLTDLTGVPGMSGSR